MAKRKTPAPRTIDMSSEAIDLRLRELGQLYELGLELRSARWVGTLEEVQGSGHEQEETSE